VSDRALRIASAALAAVGAGISGYLLYVRAAGSELVCATGGCETVQGSQYAELFGVPVSALGLVGYLTLLVATLARGDRVRLACAVLALAAFAFSTYLLYLRLQVIGSTCDWCLASDAVVTGIAACSLLRLGAVAQRATA
jgi:uncharacterized membrane protein